MGLWIVVPLICHLCHRPQGLRFKCLHVKGESVWHISFQEECLNMNWNGNLDSSIGKSARLSNPEIRGSNPGSGSNFSLEI